MKNYKPDLIIDEDENEKENVLKQTISGPMNKVYPLIL
jgi:hypothetical protein